MAVWDDVVTEEERGILKSAGYGHRQALGDRPALLVIDVTYAFVGRAPLPIAEAVAISRTSCGEAAWTAVGAIEKLLPVARGVGIPIVYSTGRDVRTTEALGRWSTKNNRTSEDLNGSGDKNEIVTEIAPSDGDVVLRKSKPSVFFGTDLLSILIDRHVDSLVVVGGTTSGCVRASVVDAFSYNYRVAVVADATFDRSATSHKVNLFDMDCKYSNVWSLQTALDYLVACEG